MLEVAYVLNNNKWRTRTTYHSLRKMGATSRRRRRRRANKILTVEK